MLAKIIVYVRVEHLSTVVGRAHVVSGGGPVLMLVHSWSAADHAYSAHIHVHVVRPRLWWLVVHLDCYGYTLDIAADACGACGGCL